MSCCGQIISLASRRLPNDVLTSAVGFKIPAPQAAKPVEPAKPVKAAKPGESAYPLK